MGLKDLEYMVYQGSGTNEYALLPATWGRVGSERERGREREREREKQTHMKKHREEFKCRVHVVCSIVSGCRA